MFFNFFEFLFHAYYQLLDVGIVSFGTQGIYFPPDLLRDKTKLFAISIGIFQGFDKILTMRFQSYFFLGDIQFINIVYQFLLKALLIISNSVKNQLII